MLYDMDMDGVRVESESAGVEQLKLFALGLKSDHNTMIKRFLSGWDNLCICCGVGPFINTRESSRRIASMRVQRSIF